jgi:hypothetical protein
MAPEATPNGFCAAPRAMVANMDLQVERGARAGT